MLPPPLYEDHTGTTFHPCCGKRICNGCIFAMVESGAKDLCPFCRTPKSMSNKETIGRINKLMEKGNGHAFYILAGLYAQGSMGMPQSRAKANELYLKAGEFGFAEGYFNLGNAYYNGNGVDVDKKKAKHYFELAVMNGDVDARHNLGCMEGQAGNYQRAMKHCLIAAKAGYKPSLDIVKGGFIDGHVTKEEYANALQEYQKIQDEMKSEARDKAAAMRNQ